MVTDEVDYVLGVDTHRDEHVLAVVTAPAGAVIAKQSVGANRRGYREALCLAERYAPGARAWAIEGAGHYGGGLARYLSERGEAVLEISRTPRAERRLRGKDDPLDASGRRGLRLPARRSRCRARVSGEKRCACS